MSILKAGRPSSKEIAMNQMRDDKEVVSRITLDIPHILYKELKQRALDEDTTLSDILRKSVKAYLSK